MHSVESIHKLVYPIGFSPVLIYGAPFHEILPMVSREGYHLRTPSIERYIDGYPVRTAQKHTKHL